MFKNLKVITFAKGNFIPSAELLKNELRILGVEKFKIIKESDLDLDFISKYKKFLLFKKGYGFCIWKPYIILKELTEISSSEVLLYIDSTDIPKLAFFKKMFSHLETNSIFLLNRGYKNSEWTKRDTFILMGCDNYIFHNTVQLEAGVISLKNNKFIRDLLKQWMFYATNDKILFDNDNLCGLPNLPNFKEHRYDQSILTNLAIQLNLKSFNLGSDFILYNYNQPEVYG
jgi:hypothetical protein